MGNDLMERNAVDNHYRALKTIIGVVVLIAFGTTATYMAGKASGTITGTVIAGWLTYSVVIIGLAAVMLRLFPTKPWLKWFMVLVLLMIVMSCRVISPVSETIAMMYIVVILSLLYFDVRLTVITCILCIIADIALMQYMPVMKPAANALAIRYFTFIFAAVAAGMGSIATQNLMQLAYAREKAAQEAGLKLQNEASLIQKNANDLSNTTAHILQITQNNRESFRQIDSSIEDIASTASTQATATDSTSRTVGK